jgi:hypothetical protein
MFPVYAAIGMLLLDAVIAVARADLPDQWRRYCEIAPRVIGDRPEAAGREMLSTRLLRGTYAAMRWVNGSPAEGETYRLEQIILEAFVAAVRAGRYRVRGFRRGDLVAADIPVALITVKAFKSLKGDEWLLGGDTWHGVSVDRVMEEPGPPPPSPPELEDASDEEIHVEIDAIYKDCIETGRKRPNSKEIGKPVQERLRTKRLCAPLRRIQPLVLDKRYVGIRPKSGPRQQRRKLTGTAPEPR